MARDGEADQIQGHNPDVTEYDIRASYHSMSRQTKAAQETAWLLQAHIGHFATLRTDQERHYRARVRQWQMRDWLVRSAATDHEGTETVNGCESTLWDTELEGYLSTDTHRGRRAADPTAATAGAAAPTPPLETMLRRPTLTSAAEVACEAIVCVVFVSV